MISTSLKALTDEEKLEAVNAELESSGVRQKILHHILQTPSFSQEFLATNNLANYKSVFNKQGLSPLLHSLSLGKKIDSDVFDKFLEAGFNLNEIDHYGRSILEYIIVSGDNETAVKLIEAGADVNQHILGLMDQNVVEDELSEDSRMRNSKLIVV